ncbi:MAG TPA: MATE family efflux transporter [Sutterellaceae bacterium]|nr:MATE family efflux transporter [Sutterellaceae bacterium]
MRPTNTILGQHFSIAGQLRFTFPRMLMSLFIMSYMVADGVLISRYMGTVALASLNMIFPLAIFLGAVGIMLSAGGGSVVSRRMGAGDSAGADRALSTLVYAEFAFGVIVGLLGILLLDPLLDFLNVNEEQYAYAYEYQIVWLAFMPCFLLSVLSQTFFTVAGFPKLGLAVSIASGLTNVVLDIVFMGPFGWGMYGGALATVISWIVATVAGGIFFCRTKAPIKIILTRPDWAALKGACTSGFSEMVGSLSSSVTLYLFNAAFMYWLGVDGVAALTIASYSTYVFNSIFYGFCEATGPILGYKYGEQNWTELACVFKNSLVIMTVFSLAAYGMSVIFAAPVLAFFTPRDSPVFELVLANFGYFALSLLLLCPNMFAAYLFTAMGDGKRAAIVSFCRTFLFTVLAIECLPLLIGEIGLWLSVPLAETLTFILSVTLIIRNKRRYGYDGQPALVINRD